MDAEARKRFEAWFDDESAKPRNRRLGWDHQLACAEWGIAEGLRIAAEIARTEFPRGGAHTYASENADRYRAFEDASEVIGVAIESLLAQEEKP